MVFIPKPFERFATMLMLIIKFVNTDVDFPFISKDPCLFFV